MGSDSSTACRTSASHGATTQFAVGDIASDRASTHCNSCHRHQKLLTTLCHIDPNAGHLLSNDYAEYKDVKVRNWLAHYLSGLLEDANRAPRLVQDRRSGRPVGGTTFVQLFCLRDTRNLLIVKITHRSTMASLTIEIPSLKSLFVEMYVGETKLSSGTAILIANNRESHCALVTARHNVTGRHQDTNQYLSRHAVSPDNILIHFHSSDETPEPQWTQVRLPLYRENRTPYWIEHPRLAGAVDIVALNVNWGSDVTKYPYYLNTDLDSVNMVIDPAETVSVIGFPFGLRFGGNFPVWVTGFVTHEMSLVNDENLVFIIDCRTRQGQSGSPVIAFRTSSYRHIEDGRKVTTITVDNHWEFLGIYTGRINAESDLGKVWHVSAVRELLSAAERDMVERNRPQPPDS